MKKLFIVLGLFLFAANLLFAVAPGGQMIPKDVLKEARPILAGAEVKSPDYTIITFFDALSPDSLECLRMLDAIPDLFQGKKIQIIAIARNPEQTVKEIFSAARFKPEFLSLYADNEKKTVFSEFATAEVLIPVAMVIQDEKVRWKGAPIELESVLKRMFNDTYSLQKQVRIDILRKELQGAVQAGLSDVILRSAGDILKVDPADTIAIQATLYVLEGRQRPDLARAFLTKQVGLVPQDVPLRLLQLNQLIGAGNRAAFQEALIDALKVFSADAVAQARLLAFSLETAPFGWLPLKEMTAASKTACVVDNTQTLRRRTYLLEIAARLAYLSMDIDGAIRLQTDAAAGSDSAKNVLEYYRSVKALNGK